MMQTKEGSENMFPILNYVRFKRLGSKSLDLGIPHLKIWTPSIQNEEVHFRIPKHLNFRIFGITLDDKAQC